MLEIGSNKSFQSSLEKLLQSEDIGKESSFILKKATSLGNIDEIKSSIKEAEEAKGTVIGKISQYTQEDRFDEVRKENSRKKVIETSIEILNKIYAQKKSEQKQKEKSENIEKHKKIFQEEKSKLERLLNRVQEAEAKKINLLKNTLPKKVEEYKEKLFQAIENNDTNNIDLCAYKVKSYQKCLEVLNEKEKNIHEKAGQYFEVIKDHLDKELEPLSTVSEIVKGNNLITTEEIIDRVSYDLVRLINKFTSLYSEEKEEDILKIILSKKEFMKKEGPNIEFNEIRIDLKEEIMSSIGSNESSDLNDKYLKEAIKTAKSMVYRLAPIFKLSEDVGLSITDFSLEEKERFIKLVNENYSNINFQLELAKLKEDYSVISEQKTNLENKLESTKGRNLVLATDVETYRDGEETAKLERDEFRRLYEASNEELANAHKRNEELEGIIGTNNDQYTIALSNVKKEFGGELESAKAIKQSHELIVEQKHDLERELKNSQQETIEAYGKFNEEHENHQNTKNMHQKATDAYKAELKSNKESYDSKLKAEKSHPWLKRLLLGVTTAAAIGVLGLNYLGINPTDVDQFKKPEPVVRKVKTIEYVNVKVPGKTIIKEVPTDQERIIYLPSECKKPTQAEVQSNCQSMTDNSEKLADQYKSKLEIGLIKKTIKNEQDIDEILSKYKFPIITDKVKIITRKAKYYTNK